MRNNLINLTRNIINRLDKALDMPKYRVKHEEIVAFPHDHFITFSRKTNDGQKGISFTISKEAYFAIKDKIKSFDKKHEERNTEIN